MAEPGPIRDLSLDLPKPGDDIDQETPLLNDPKNTNTNPKREPIASSPVRLLDFTKSDVIEPRTPQKTPRLKHRKQQGRKHELNEIFSAHLKPVKFN